MTVSLRALQAFLAFHKRGTIAGAAEEIHLSAAAVSAQLKLLEERVGVPLFLRTKRSLALSPDGLRLIPIAEKMLSVQEELLHFSDFGSLHGRLSIGAINTVLVGIFPAVLNRIKRENPKLKIEVSSGLSSELVSKVEAGALDAAVINMPPYGLPSGLIIHPLYKEPIALVQSAATHYRTVDEALQKAEYIALNRNTWLGRFIDNWLSSAGLSAFPAMELSSQPAVLAAVEFELGVSILPVIRGQVLSHNRRVSYTKIEGFQRIVGLVERQSHVKSHIIAQLLSVITTLTGEH